MPEDYLLVLIRRTAQMVATILLGRRDESPETLRQNLHDDFRLFCGIDLALLLRRTPDELVALLASGGDALFAERALILSATLVRLVTVEEGAAAKVSELQCRALLDGLRQRFGAGPESPLAEALGSIEDSLETALSGRR